MKKWKWKTKRITEEDLRQLEIEENLKDPFSSKTKKIIIIFFLILIIIFTVIFATFFSKYFIIF